MKYKFKCGDEVALYSICGGEMGIKVVVYACYTSDEENHPATPHNRYVVYRPKNNGNLIDYYLYDVSENELGERREGNIDL